MPSTEARAARVQAIDIARALAIIGVVFNHTIDGLVTAGIMNGSSPIAEFNRALYIFRMPALAFVLGLFIGRAAEKRSTLGYIQEKVTFAVYIYLVWFVLQMLAEIATSGIKNTPRGWDSLLSFWAMPAHLWFMPFLAVSAVVISLAAPWRTANRTIVAGALIGLASILAWGWNPGIFGLRGLSLLIFSAAGAAIGAQRLGTSLTCNAFGWACCGVLSLGVFIILFIVGATPGTIETPGDESLIAKALSATAAAFGIVVLLSLAVITSHVPFVRDVLVVVGANTLQVYLAHVMVVAGTRIALAKLGISSELIFLAAAMILGIGAPVLLAILAPRLRMSWLFHTPGALGAWSRRANKHHIAFNLPVRNGSSTAG